MTNLVTVGFKLSDADKVSAQNAIDQYFRNQSINSDEIWDAIICWASSGKDVQMTHQKMTHLLEHYYVACHAAATSIRCTTRREVEYDLDTSSKDANYIYLEWH